jgi:Aspartyl protease
MKLTQFDALEDNSDVIIVLATIENKYGFEMAFDTAATHTTLDSNMLYMSGYKLKNAVGEIEIETSNGIITVNLYNIINFECLGIRKDILQVQVYDFAAHGITSEYAGVLGLNFLKDHKFCVDMIKGEITIN